MKENTQLKILFTGLFFGVLIFSSLIGYYIKPEYGYVTFFGGVFIVIGIPLLVLREMFKEDANERRNLREDKQ